MSIRPERKRKLTVRHCCSFEVVERDQGLFVSFNRARHCAQCIEQLRLLAAAAEVVGGKPVSLMGSLGPSACNPADLDAARKAV
jgi:hypothetical protein